MGAYRSKLTPEEVEELASTTHFSSREIDVLYSRFKKLDRKRAGYITSQEFYLIPELSMNPLCDRIIAIFDPDKSEQITFDAFVHTVHLFSQHATLQERTKGQHHHDSDAQTTPSSRCSCMLTAVVLFPLRCLALVSCVSGV
jgi:Ca2+-binding EF-hand superfamily protein